MWGDEMGWNRQEFEKKYKPQVDTPLDPDWQDICGQCTMRTLIRENKLDRCYLIASYFGRPVVSEVCQFVTELAISGVVVIENNDFINASKWRID